MTGMHALHKITVLPLRERIGAVSEHAAPAPTVAVAAAPGIGSR